MTTQVMFDDEEVPTYSPNDQEPALFITTYINYTYIQRVMVDGGASINIISSHAYLQLQLPDHYLAQTGALL